jgi:hypothetical protein
MALRRVGDYPLVLPCIGSERGKNCVILADAVEKPEEALADPEAEPDDA